jgi:hypothetical protein
MLQGPFLLDPKGQFRQTISRYCPFKRLVRCNHEGSRNVKLIIIAGTATDDVHIPFLVQAQEAVVHTEQHHWSVRWQAG